MGYIKKNCRKIEAVKRNLLFRKEPLEMSNLGICPIFVGKYWKVWSSSRGIITVESISGKNFDLPIYLNPSDFKRVSERVLKMKIF